MSTSIDFIREYGDKTFDELPFCDIDNLALCEIFYMPFDKVINDHFNKEPILFSDACNKVFAYNGYKNVGPGLILPKKISAKMMTMSRCKRYQDIKIVACQSAFGTNPALQFAAMTLILPDGTLVVVYRGTDDTLAGWKEDFDIYLKKGIPSHKLGVNYLNNIAERYEGSIIVCGHSKGGHVSLYSAMHCKEEVRARIKTVYNNDGPGFDNFDFIKSKEYKELLPKYKHFIPSNSFIGVILAHDDDYKIVKNTKFLGMLQHDASTWKTNGTEFLTKEDRFALSKITDLSLMEIILTVNDEESAAFDRILTAIVEGTGQINLTNFARNIVSSIKGAKKALASIDDETKLEFHDTFAGSTRVIADAVKTVVEDEVIDIEGKVKQISAANS